VVEKIKKKLTHNDTKRTNFHEVISEVIN